MRRLRLVAWIAASFGTLYVGGLAAQSRIEVLPPLSVDETGAGTAFVNAISRDGRVVVGTSVQYSPTGTELGVRAVRWNADAEILELAPAEVDENGAASANAVDVSGDGNFATGWSDRDDGSGGISRRPVRWDTATGEAQFLTTEANGFAIGNAISDDGAVVVGAYRTASGDRAVRWDDAGALYPLEFLVDPGDSLDYSTADAVSGDGAIIAGGAQFDFGSSPIETYAFRWNGTGPGQALDSLAEADDIIYDLARAISRDGSTIVGRSAISENGQFQGYAPVKWHADGSVHQLQALASGPGDPPEVTLVSDDGEVCAGIGGYYGSPGDLYLHAMRWTGESSLEVLISFEDVSRGTTCRALSADGLVAAGFSSTTRAGGGATIWVDDVRARQLFALLEERGVDLTGWQSLDDIVDCSADGQTVVGYGIFEGKPAAFRATVDLFNDPPTIEPRSLDGETFELRLGQTLTIPDLPEIVGDDPEGEDLTLTVTGLPASATVTPEPDTTGPSPRGAVFEFTPGTGDEGTYEVTVGYADESNATAELSFTIVVAENVPPAVDPVEAVEVECEGEENLVTLATTVSDADGHGLAVSWVVDGVVIETRSGILSGTTVEFEYDYPDGESTVQIGVHDGYEGTIESTTVTVVDTTAPVVIVGADVTVSTDPGVDFASDVVLPPPRVTDICDGEPELTNDAPDLFELGTTTVVWTAIDADGNRTRANQRVTVVDREDPRIVAGADVTVRVDEGEIFATLNLGDPRATDNVPGGLVLTDDERTTYPIGRTRVTWTATDAAGNSTSATQLVTVIHDPPVADAGQDVVLTTSDAGGLRVTLDGAASFDVDGQSIKYAWVANDIVFDRATRSDPTALFPLGTTKVRLVVTDAAGEYDEDTVDVTVKLKQLFVYETRPGYPLTSGFVDEAVWRSQALVDVDPENVNLQYAAQLAAIAQAFDDYASAVTYIDSSDYENQLALYKYWRYWQLQYSFLASQYAYYGYLYASPGVAIYYYEYLGASTYYNAYAGYFGLYDFDST